MVPLLLPNFGSSLKWYQFSFRYRIVPTFRVRVRVRKNYKSRKVSTILYLTNSFVCDFSYFSSILVPFLLQNFAVFPNGTFLVAFVFLQIVAKFSQMVPFLLVNFYHFLKWYQFCR